MAFGMGKSNTKIYVLSTEGIRFQDVAGEDEAKESLAEIVDYLHNPEKYTKVRASMPKRVLLVGLPETRKTMLAKAIAGGGSIGAFLFYCRFGICKKCLWAWALQGAGFITTG